MSLLIIKDVKYSKQRSSEEYIIWYTFSKIYRDRCKLSVSNSRLSTQIENKNQNYLEIQLLLKKNSLNHTKIETMNLKRKQMKNK